jgi:hypothetical protein
MFVPIFNFSKLSCQYLYVQQGSNNMFFRGREKQSKSSLKSYLNTTEQFIIPAQGFKIQLDFTAAFILFVFHFCNVFAANHDVSYPLTHSSKHTLLFPFSFIILT